MIIQNTEANKIFPLFYLHFRNTLVVQLAL